VIGRAIARAFGPPLAGVGDALGPCFPGLIIAAGGRCRGSGRNAGMRPAPVLYMRPLWSCWGRSAWVLFFFFCAYAGVSPRGDHQPRPPTSARESKLTRLAPRTRSRFGRELRDGPSGLHRCGLGPLLGRHRRLPSGGGGDHPDAVWASPKNPVQSLILAFQPQAIPVGPRPVQNVGFAWLQRLPFARTRPHEAPSTRPHGAVTPCNEHRPRRWAPVAGLLCAEELY